jgi:hypothetical protein
MAEGRPDELGLVVGLRLLSAATAHPALSRNVAAVKLAIFDIGNFLWLAPPIERLNRKPARMFLTVPYLRESTVRHYRLPA